eukprot:443783-Amphidinium_carterae.1
MQKSILRHEVEETSSPMNLRRMRSFSMQQAWTIERSCASGKKILAAKVVVTASSCASLMHGSSSWEQSSKLDCEICQAHGLANNQVCLCCAGQIV